MPPRKGLTISQCQNAAPRTKSYKLADGDGMYLEISPSGGRYWRLKYRFAGKEKRLALGVFPEVSLAEAREKRVDARRLLASGVDPSEARQEQKRATLLNASNTFEAVAREWHEHSKGGCSARHALGLLHRLEMDIFPEIGHRPIADITARQVLDALRKIEKRGAHEVGWATHHLDSVQKQIEALRGRADAASLGHAAKWGWFKRSLEEAIKKLTPLA